MWGFHPFDRSVEHKHISISKTCISNLSPAFQWISFGVESTKQRVVICCPPPQLIVVDPGGWRSPVRVLQGTWWYGMHPGHFGLCRLHTCGLCLLLFALTPLMLICHPLHQPYQPPPTISISFKPTCFKLLSVFRHFFFSPLCNALNY